ncbi:HipA-like protein family [Salinisphaera sp. PC39]
MPGRLPGAIADAAPDNWGRRVIEYRSNQARLSEIEYLLSGGGDRIGALHFQPDPHCYQPPKQSTATLSQILDAAAYVESQAPLPEDLRLALEHGTSIGGARPKAAIRDEHGHWIAKFSSSQDRFSVVESELATLSLARLCGIDVPEHRLAHVDGKSILLVRRFDRLTGHSGITRRLLLSALTLLQLDETEARLASYPELAEVLRRLSRRPQEDTVELYRRMVFNILIGNTDDHAKNHACFWDGEWLELTPAYDLLPTPRVGQEGRQAMDVGDAGKASTLSNARSQAGRFGLTVDQAEAVIADTCARMADWKDMYEQAGVPPAEIDRLSQATIMSPVALT